MLLFSQIIMPPKLLLFIIIFQLLSHSISFNSQTNSKLIIHLLQMMLSEFPKVITVGHNVKIKCNKCLCAYYVTGPDLDARDTWGAKQTDVPEWKQY